MGALPSARRAAARHPHAFGVVVVAFLLLYVAPGDPVARWWASAPIPQPSRVCARSSI